VIFKLVIAPFPISSGADREVVALDRPTDAPGATMSQKPL
jgi:hypothetical protein